MSLVGYRTHSITLRAANMRRGALVNSAAARRLAFFTESAKYLLQKSGSWININIGKCFRVIQLNIEPQIR